MSLQSVAADDERMAAPAVVGRSDHAACMPPLLEDALDRLRSESRPVREDDDRRLDLRPERGEPAAQRRSWPSLPVGAGDDPRVVGDLECVRALDDDDLVDRRLAQALEHARKEDALLGASEPGRLAGREDDRGDGHQLSVTVTLEMTTGCDGGPSPARRVRRFARSCPCHPSPGRRSRSPG